MNKIGIIQLICLLCAVLFIAGCADRPGSVQIGKATPTATTTTAVVSLPLAITPHNVPTATALPTATPTPSAQLEPTAPPTPAQGSGDRYFPAGTSVSALKSKAAALTKQQVKAIIVQQVSEHWSVIQGKLGFSSKEKGYAFFLGMATRESTLNGALETGSGPSHSYGALQAAEPAYANTGQNYAPEKDVPEMLQYAFTPQNYYDPGIAVHMGIRHLLHFANQARAAGYTGTELLRYTLIGYNTGVIETSDQEWIREYSDEIGALAGWYLTEGHLYDSAFTWTTDPDVDRSNSWGWL